MPLETIDVEALERIVIDKCENFVQMGLWPAGDTITYKRWLANFSTEDKEMALYLLNAFTYYNKDFCVALLKAAIVDISRRTLDNSSFRTSKTQWISFLSKTIFVPATGESRNITDSGVNLSSYLRRTLKISETQILTVDDLYSASYKGFLESSYDNVIFFDDLIGSGNQFITMFNDEFEKDTDLLDSVGKRCKTLNLKPFYCVMMGTRYGIERINNRCPEVELSCAHIITPSDSPYHEECSIWPSRLKENSLNFLTRAAEKAGIKESEMRGYHNLGLVIAFEWTIPDCTIPIFSTKNPNWSALMEKI